MRRRVLISCLILGLYNLNAQTRTLYEHPRTKVLSTQPVQGAKKIRVLVNSGIFGAIMRQGGISSAEINDFAVRNEHLGTETVDSRVIKDGSIEFRDLNAELQSIIMNRNELADNSVQNRHLAPESVTLSKLHPDVLRRIDAPQLADGYIISRILADKSVTDEKLADDSVDTVHLKDDSVTSNKIKDDQITMAKLADDVRNAIRNSGLTNDSVGTEHIRNGAVTSPKLASGAVTSEKIAAGAVGSAHIAAGAVGTNQIANRSITADKIQDGAIGSSSLANLAVTTAKLAQEAVTSEKLANRSVTKTKLNLNLQDLPFTEFFGSTKDLINNGVYAINGAGFSGLSADTYGNRIQASSFLNRSFRRIYFSVWVSHQVPSNTIRRFTIIDAYSGSPITINNSEISCIISAEKSECSVEVQGSTAISGRLLAVKHTSTNSAPTNHQAAWYVAIE